MGSHYYNSWSPFNSNHMFKCIKLYNAVVTRSVSNSIQKHLQIGRNETKTTTSLQDISWLDSSTKQCTDTSGTETTSPGHQVASQHQQLYAHLHIYIHTLQPHFDYIFQNVQSDNQLNFAILKQRIWTTSPKHGKVRCRNDNSSSRESNISPIVRNSPRSL
jgi:hypothetical protein